MASTLGIVWGPFKNLLSDSTVSFGVPFDCSYQ